MLFEIALQARKVSNDPSYLDIMNSLLLDFDLKILNVKIVHFLA